jgi:hypothetical protein
MDVTAAKTGVVYLYRFAEGEGPVRRFLDSYRRYPAGLAHDLHVILKGFPDRSAVNSACALFTPLPINAIEVDDAGYDIGSYFAAARAVANPQLLFLNTFSEILAESWLSHFDHAHSMPGVGIVGATGSWQSIRTVYEAKFLRILRHPSRLLWRHSGSAASAPEKEYDADDLNDRVDVGYITYKLGRISLYPLRMYQFSRHPNPHIRSNAFMIRRDVFLSLRAAALKTKVDAYRFESGRHSMTRQIIASGLQPAVVDRDGRVYSIAEWRSSSTFWIDLQANLLVADNQTRRYDVSNLDRQQLLKNYAWDKPSSWYEG